MADTNQISAEMEAVLRQVQEDLKNLGYVSKDTGDKLKAAEDKAKKFEMGMGLAGKAATSLAKAGMEAASAMYEGKKGAAAFNSSVDSMAEAAMAAGAMLTLMIPGGPVVKALIAGFTLAVGALAKYTKAANEMSDKLYTSFQKMSKSGAAASDGMSGIYKGMQKLGLGIQDLDGYVTLLNENSQDLALFGGAVFEGRKRFEDMGAAMEPFREQLYNAGLSQEEINKGAMGYLKLQTQLGRSQTMSTQQLADGAKKYLIEQDALTKLTGQSREEMEKQAEAALMEEQYAAKIRELELAGNKDAVDALRKMNAVYSQAGPEMGRAFRASVTGNLSNADAQKANMASNGEMVRTTQAVIAGQLNFKDAINTTGKAMGNTADTVGTTLGQFNAYNDTFGNFSEQQKLRIITEKDLNETLSKIDKDQRAQGIQGGKAADAAQQAQTDLRMAQLDAMKATQDFVFKGIVPATEAMIKLAKGTKAAAEFADEATPGGKAASAGSDDYQKNQENIKKQQEEAAKKWAEEMPWWLGGNKKEEPPAPPPPKPEAPPPKPPAPAPALAAPAPAPAPAPAGGAPAPAPASRGGRGSPPPAPAPAGGASAAPASGAPAGPAPAAVSGAPARPAPAGPAPAPAGGAPASPTAAPSGAGASKGKGSAPSGSEDVGAKPPADKPVAAPAAPSGDDVQMGQEVRIGNEIRKGGTVSWRTNNPGNISYGGLSKKYGAVGTWKKLDGDAQQRSTGIAIMPNLDAGDELKMGLWRRPMYIDKTIDQGVAQWTGTTGLGSGYAKDLAKAAGATMDTVIGQLSDSQLKSMVQKQRVWEGFKAGQVVSAASGGMFDGPKSGYPATLHGNEAVIPLKNGSVPVTINSTGLMDLMPKMDMDSEMSEKMSQSFAKVMPPEFKNLVDSLSTMVQQQQNTNSTAIQERMVALLEDIKRSQETTATASERMAAVASN